MKSKLWLVILVGLMMFGRTQASGQQVDALIDELVSNGTLSHDQADHIREKLAKDYSQTAAGKLALSDSVKKLTLYGDARLRYEYIDQHAQRAGQSSAAGNLLTDQFRYRLRIGADYQFADNFSAGFELESSTANDSSNQTFGSQFGKYPINVGLVYLKYKATDWATFTAGKFRNPLYTTELVWDADINPEGGAEQLLFNPTDKLSIGLTAGQFIYAANNELSTNVYGSTGTGPTGGANVLSGTGSSGSDVWIFAEQIPVTYAFTDKLNVKFAPGFIAYTGGGNLNTTASPLGNTGIVTTNPNGGSGSYYDYRAGNDLAIFTAPGEVNFKLGDLPEPFKVFWDFAYNTLGKERVQNVYFGGNPTAATASGIPASTAFTKQNLGLGDNLAWAAGVQVGQLKKKGDWLGKAEFRQVGLGALDPNTNESDFGDSLLNQQGFRISGAYQFSDAVSGVVSYADTWNYKSKLFDQTQPTPVAGSEAANANTLANANSTQRIQFDLLWKF